MDAHRHYVIIIRFSVYDYVNTNQVMQRVSQQLTT